MQLSRGARSLFVTPSIGEKKRMKKKNTPGLKTHHVSSPIPALLTGSPHPTPAIPVVSIAVSVAWFEQSGLSLLMFKLW